MANSEIVYRPVKVVLIDSIPAGITLQEPIIVPAGENSVSDATFIYNVGTPAADMWMVAFFGSEADAEADRNPITDVANFLSYEIHPAVPVQAAPQVSQDGYIRLTRLAAIPYPTICLKFSICQPETEEPEKIGTVIRAGITPLAPARRPTIPTWEIH